VVVESSKVYLADLLARRTLERQPTVAGVQGGVECRVIEKRAASIPDVDYLLSARTRYRFSRASALFFGVLRSKIRRILCIDGVAWS
jgi:hypothetical protein